MIWSRIPLLRMWGDANGVPFIVQRKKFLKETVREKMNVKPLQLLGREGRMYKQRWPELVVSVPECVNCTPWSKSSFADCVHILLGGLDKRNQLAKQNTPNQSNPPRPKK